MRIPVFTILLCLLIGFVCDFFLWRQVASDPKVGKHSRRSGKRRGRHRSRRSSRRNTSKGLRRIFWLTTGLCWLLLIVAMAWPYRSAGVILPKMWLIFIWATIYCGKIIYLFWCLIGSIPELWHGRRMHLGRYVGIPLAILGCALLWWSALVNRNDIIVNQVEITSARIPAEFENYRIAQISDLHVGTWGNDTTFVSMLVDSVNALHPDVIVFTGDLVNRMTAEVKPFIPVLSRLKAPCGVIAVLGNHDYGMYFDWESETAERANMAQLVAVNKQMGWTLLRNQYQYIHRGGASIAVVGLENWGEPPYPSFGDIEKALHTPIDSMARPLGDQWRLILSHNPEYWDRTLSKRAYGDLTLSGHTHAMQISVTVNGKTYSPAAFKYRHWGGLYLNENDPAFGELYVNAGAGTVGMPFRLGATPEITLFILHSQKE